MNIQVDAVLHLTRSQAFMASIVANDARGSSLDRWEGLRRGTVKHGEGTHRRTVFFFSLFKLALIDNFFRK